VDAAINFFALAIRQGWSADVLKSAVFAYSTAGWMSPRCCEPNHRGVPIGIATGANSRGPFTTFQQSRSSASAREYSWRSADACSIDIF
jgi:hypothetical protein